MAKAATCSTCGKRLSKKQWYYRNGQYFCTQHCWNTAKAKAQQEKVKAADAPAAGAPAAKPEKKS